MATPSRAPRGDPRQGGKEELRASVLKTYVLRLRAEKGDARTAELLEAAGVDPRSVDRETDWLSGAAAIRALRAIAEQIGGVDALRQRGEWATHPEALGTLVRMIRAAKTPLDAYRYLAANAREATRLGTWELEELPPEGKAASTTVRMTYRRRDDEEVDEPTTPQEEVLLCAARWGEVASYPRIFGLADPEVTHEKCLGKGEDACVYRVRWSLPARGRLPIVVGVGSALLCVVPLAFLGGLVSALLASLVVGALGAALGHLWERAQADRRERVFEKHRIAALERGLELRGEAGPAPAPGELVGSVLGGRYKILRKIGSGGIGVVYAAEHATLGHEVAVKVLRGAAAKDGGEIARLRREAYIQANVDHPNVVRVLDLDQMPDGSIYVVMERLVGRSLADKMARDGVVAPGLALPIFIGVCRALAAAHAKGVVHRDLKPGNVFLLNEASGTITPERIKVLDFGMGKLYTAESLTQAGYTLGTPEYMAPEQCIGARVEPRTDLYALGVMMYEAIVGELPIKAQNRRDLLDLHQRQIPTPMRLRRPDLPIPEGLDVAVMMCLRKKAHDRPASAEALEKMLAAVPMEGLPTAYPASGARKRASEADAPPAVEPTKDKPPASELPPTRR
jgi:serine/threonine-protein kinase